MKRYIKYLFCFLFLFCVVSICDVKAEDYTKSIRCYYKGIIKESYRNTDTKVTTIGNTFPFVYGVQYKCKDDKCSSRTSWGNGTFSDNGYTVSVPNYDDFFVGSNLNKYEKLFGYKKGEGFSRCPKYMDYEPPTIIGTIKEGESNWIKIKSFTDSFIGAELIETEMNASDSGLEAKVSDLASKYHGTISEKADGSDSPSIEIEKDSSNEEYAKVIKDWMNEHGEDSYKDNSKYDKADCAGLLKPFKNELKSAIAIMNITGAIILVLTMSIDFVKAIVSSDADIMAATFKRFKNRIIATIVLLVLPVLLNFVIEIINQNVVKTGDGEIKIGKTSDCLK